MVSDSLRQRIARFVNAVGERYELVEGVSREGVEHVCKIYVPSIISLPEDAKERILRRLEESWRDNQDHGMIRQWGRAAIGTAQFLLLPTNPTEVDRIAAADVVVRISRWRHSTGSNIWKRFIPTATFVVEAAWGDIERLYEEFGARA